MQVKNAPSEIILTHFVYIFNNMSYLRVTPRNWDCVVG